MIISRFKILQENNYQPSMIFTTENPYSKLFLGRTFSIVKRFLKLFQHILGQTKHKKVFLQLKEIEDIHEIPLSESRNYTLV